MGGDLVKTLQCPSAFELVISGLLVRRAIKYTIADPKMGLKPSVYNVFSPEKKLSFLP